MVETDAFEAEGSGAAARVASLAILAGPQQPEVGDDDEVDDVKVGGSPDGVHGVEAGEESLDEEEVGRVGSGLWVVFVSKGLVKRVE